MTEDHQAGDMDLVEVRKVWGPAEMEVIKTLLASHGISSMTRGQVPQSILPMTTDGMGEIKILVPKKDASAAKKIIEQALEESKD